MALNRAAIAVKTRYRASARGAATVELAILLPIYLLLVFGLIYLGFAALDTQRITEIAGYAALQPGMQSADEAQQSLTWHGAVEAAWSDKSGTFARTAETVQYLQDAADAGDFYDLDHVTETLGGIAVADWYGGGFVWTPDGIISSPAHRVGNDRADYLVNNAIASDTAPLQTTTYESWLTLLLNGYAAGGPWLERSSANVELIFNPPYFGRVFSQDALTAGEYFSGQGEQTIAAPTLSAAHSVALRGAGERLGAHAIGAGGVLRDIAGLMIANPLPPAIAPVDRDAAGAIYWPATPNIWIPR